MGVQQGNISQDTLQDMFKRALAAAVEVPLEFVVKLNVSDLGEVSEIEEASGVKPFARRLRGENEKRESQSEQASIDVSDNQTKLYDVAYEIMVPEYMDADAIIEKANRIAEPGSNESQLFRQVLLETDGVIGVGKIVSKVSAYKVGEEATTEAPSKPTLEDDDDETWKAWLIGLSVAFVVVVCGVSSVILIKRKVFPVEAGNAHNAKAGDIEDGRRDLDNEKVVTNEPRAAQAPEAVREIPAPVPLPVKNSAASQAVENTPSVEETVEECHI